VRTPLAARVFMLVPPPRSAGAFRRCARCRARPDQQPPGARPLEGASVPGERIRGTSCIRVMRGHKILLALPILTSYEHVAAIAAVKSAVCCTSGSGSGHPQVAAVSRQCASTGEESSHNSRHRASRSSAADLSRSTTRAAKPISADAGDSSSSAARRPSAADLAQTLTECYRVARCGSFSASFGRSRVPHSVRPGACNATQAEIDT
jgi:hypothetical protein